MLPCLFCDCMRQNDSFNKFIQNYESFDDAIANLILHHEDLTYAIQGNEKEIEALEKEYEKLYGINKVNNTEE